MKKILLAFDGMNFSEGSFEFARKLNKKSPIFLAAAFLPQTDIATLWSYATSPAGDLFIPGLEDSENQKIQENIQRFEKLCQENNIEYQIHNDFLSFASVELTRESRFADLLILGSQLFDSGDKNVPAAGVIDAVHDAECPVVIVPEKFEFPTCNILCYDGSEDSVYAIKQFSYLFPELTDSKSLLVFASNEQDKLPEVLNIRELIIRHFPKLEMIKLQFDPRKHFSDWLSTQGPAIVVSGSFNRSAISRVFRKSFLMKVIRENSLPLFIAHR